MTIGVGGKTADEALATLSNMTAGAMPISDAEYRERIAAFRSTNLATLAELRTLIKGDEQIESLQGKLTDYWQTFDPLFDWTPAEKIAQSAAFLRREVVPRREAALSSRPWLRPPRKAAP